MERVAGGKENLVGGFDTVAWMGFYLTILLDNDEIIHQICKIAITVSGE